MTPALFSVSYAGSWGQSSLPLLDFIDKAHELGFAAVMLMGKRPHLAPLDCTPEQAAAIKGHLDRQRVACPVVGAYTDFACAGAAEVPYLEMQIAYVASLARLAQTLGAKIVRVFTAYEAAGLTPATVWGRTVTGLRECCDRAADHGVTIAVQNHHELAVASDAMLELLGDVDRPNCKLGFDAWSLWLRDEDLFEAARRMARIPRAPPMPITSVCRVSATARKWSITCRSRRWCGRCRLARDRSILRRFLPACGRADSTAWLPTRCVHPCAAAAPQQSRSLCQTLSRVDEGPRRAHARCGSPAWMRERHGRHARQRRRHRSAAERRTG